MNVNEPHQRVLVAPLPWGLGHAARCIPLIQTQIALGNEVILAAQGAQLALLQVHFPRLRTMDIPFMEITYPRDGNMVRHFMWNGPRLLWSIWREHRLLQGLVRRHRIDLVISDARFGLWTRQCRCILVHHQIHIISPVFERVINLLNRWVMHRYDELWIPDFPVYPGLAGDLSHPRSLPSHAQYIGPLSRFSGPILPFPEKKWKAVALISGPEPQRSMFESEVIRQFIEANESALVLEGRPHLPKDQWIDGIHIVHHLSDEQLLEALASAERVIARSGYSTIMDLHVLGITEVRYHPTPGQTEQMYLARLHRGSDQS